MHVAELWRFPVKSMRGERLETARLTGDGVEGDRIVHVRGRHNVLTARTRYKLLSLAATTGPDGEPQVDGRPWNDPVTRQAIKDAAGPDAEPVRYTGPERFDVLPLLVATDGAIAELGHDGRRLRPNLVIGGVPGLAERDWPGKALRIGEVLIGVESLRGRCVMTTIDPDTGEQDLDVLRRINREFDGRVALNCWVVNGGQLNVGDAVEVVDVELTLPRRGGWVTGVPYQLAILSRATTLSER
jgi:uncharacterized protein YcbX